MRASRASLPDYRMTTAEILYHLPDFPTLLQSFIWQQADVSPDFPMLKRFLAYWERHLDGKLHSVRIAHTRLLCPSELRYARSELALH